MASAKIELSHKLRPCIVKGNKALFHRWCDEANPIGESNLRGGHSAGQIWIVLGIVEYEDGSIHKAYPDEIRFVDNPHEEYSWQDTADLK